MGRLWQTPVIDQISPQVSVYDLLPPSVSPGSILWTFVTRPIVLLFTGSRAAPLEERSRDAVQMKISPKSHTSYRRGTSGPFDWACRHLRHRMKKTLRAKHLVGRAFRTLMMGRNQCVPCLDSRRMELVYKYDHTSLSSQFDCLNTRLRLSGMANPSQVAVVLLLPEHNVCSPASFSTAEYKPCLSTPYPWSQRAALRQQRPHHRRR
ncbi:hypothetical protein BV22DRAFT_350713 [Leucogyrophana mollusca]|uniref:Uncharacterized protein n=1 Tax=Leucogyrophana mollusca TaxID=85980 RepID=A0ACB8BMX3_9AGAM|nr:hypothetical protein BV22DRAFT_350713 [Leucogyrophana mollusca]